MSGRVPPSSRAGKRSRTFAASRDAIRKAADLYERFSGHDAEVVGKVSVPNVPTVGVSIGTLDGVLYTTVRDGVTEKYIHKFKAKDKPLLVVSPDGSQMFIVGGGYDFTERGIVDASDAKTRREMGIE
jgi:predicted polyphosphate/ATP-dependent NAD kinase